MTAGCHIYLGVDGGYSGTRALLVDARGTVFGYGAGGNANHQSQGYERAVCHVAAAVEEACRAAGIGMDRVTAAHFALAGDDVEDDHECLGATLSAVWPDLCLTLGNDVWAGLRGGSVDGVGVAVNCGTGTGTVGRNARGNMAIIPDLGYMFGDSGGGSQIAADAVRAVVRAWDGRGQPTALTPEILDLTGQPTVQALYLALYRGHVTRDHLRSATRITLRAAAAGDPVATGIVRRIGTEMGVAAAAVARRLGMGEDSFPFVLTGGTIRTLRSALVDAAVERLRHDAPRCIPTLPLLQPVAGAALLALDGVGTAVTPDHYARLGEQGYAWHPEESFD